MLTSYCRLWLELHERDRDVQILKRDMLVLRLKVSQAGVWKRRSWHLLCLLMSGVDKTLDSPISSHDANYDDNDEDEDFEYWEEEKEERRHLTEEELEAEYLLEEALEDERIMRERWIIQKLSRDSEIILMIFRAEEQKRKQSM